MNMKGKRLIDLSLAGDSRHTPSTYYGRTLTSLIGSSRSAKSSLRSLEVTRLTSKVSSRPSTARSLKSERTVSSVGLSKGGDSVFTSPWNSRATSAVSRGTSGRFKKSRALESNASSVIPGISIGTSGSLADLNLDQMALNVWQLENHRLRTLTPSEYGFFHQGNCYIVLKTNDDGSSFLHTWFGSQSYKFDRDTAREHAEELDRSLDGASFLSFEHEGHETATFLSQFVDGIIVVEGASRESIGKAVKYQKRLYVVRGRRYPSATCVECSAQAVSDDSLLILDGYPRIYVWVGKNADFVLAVKAINLAKRIRTWQRRGRGHIVVIDKNDEQLHDGFMKKLTSDKPCDLTLNDFAGEEEKENVLDLYKVNGPRVLYDMPLVASRPLQQKYLTTMDTFLLDTGPSQPLCVWVGNAAESDALFGALHCVQNFTQHHNYPTTTALCRVTEGDEPMGFKTLFSDWRDRTVKERQLSRSYSVGNIGRALFSRSDRRTVAKLSEVWSDDHFLVGDGKTEIWMVNGETLVPVPQQQHGIFYNWCCYIILYRENISGVEHRVIYYWLGSKTSCEEQTEAQKLALSMDSALERKTTVMRVLDDKEPKHFLTVLQGSIIVYDADLRQDKESTERTDCSATKNTNVNMYCVQELAQECMRVTQAAPVSSSLNSSAAFVITSDNEAFLWYGKNASAGEREYAKTMLAYFCPYRSFDYDIVTEGKETRKFWALIDHQGEYPKKFCKLKLQRRPAVLVLCKKRSEKWCFVDIPDFSQEDLCETDQFILDSHDQIQLWCGATVVDREQAVISQVVKAYLKLDSSRRGELDIDICFVNQGCEPSIFTKFFSGWERHGYGGESAFYAARKRLRQENASIDIDCQMVDSSYMGIRKIPYKELVTKDNSSMDSDMESKEYHLSDKEFNRVLRMTRAQFYRLPEWKQKQILKSARLISTLSSSPNNFTSPDFDSART